MTDLCGYGTVSCVTQLIRIYTNDISPVANHGDAVIDFVPPIADRVAQNLEIVSKALSMYQNSANGIDDYGVATVSRIDQIVGLFCRISSLL